MLTHFTDAIWPLALDNSESNHVPEADGSLDGPDHSLQDRHTSGFLAPITECNNNISLSRGPPSRKPEISIAQLGDE